MIILAMGKHGAGELNYSSDIDLIVLFRPEMLAVPDQSRAAGGRGPHHQGHRQGAA